MSIEERLEKLEKELACLRKQARGKWFNRWLQPAEAAIDEVRAKQFVLEDEKGTPYAMLGTGENGPMLAFLDEKGKKNLVTLTMEGLFLRDEKGNTRAKLLVGKDGAVLFLNDEKGNTRAKLGAFDRPVLWLSDENGKLRAALDVDKDGPSLELFDEKDKLRATLDVGKDGPALDLFDEKGKVRAALGACQTVAPGGKAITYPESSIILFGPDGKATWLAP